jgi:hypothetical protein
MTDEKCYFLCLKMDFTRCKQEKQPNAKVLFMFSISISLCSKKKKKTSSDPHRIQL